MAKSEKHKLAQTLIDSINEIASISDSVTPMKKHCANLSRRLSLLLPMLEEIRDNQESSSEVVNALLSVKQSLLHAKDLLSFVSHVSKIYLVCVGERSSDGEISESDFSIGTSFKYNPL